MSEHHHDHEHTDGCGCGGHHHHHHHEHGEACGCGCQHTEAPTVEGLSPVQTDLLLALYQRHYLPVACFALTKADDADRYAVALAPVYLNGPDDSMEQVQWLGGELGGLEAQGLITLDYDMPLKDYPYNEYKTAGLYTYFQDTVAEASTLPEAAFDTPALELGSMALTDAGKAMVTRILESDVTK